LTDASKEETLLIKFACGFLLAAVAGAAFAGPVPKRPVTFVAAYAPGGVTDSLRARLAQSHAIVGPAGRDSN